MSISKSCSNLKITLRKRLSFPGQLQGRASPVLLVFLMFLLLQGKPPTKKAKVLHKAAWSAKIGAFLHSQGTGHLADGTLTGQDGECRRREEVQLLRPQKWGHLEGCELHSLLFLLSGTLPCTETACVDCSNTHWRDTGYISLPASANGSLVGSCPSTVAASSSLLVQFGLKRKLCSHSPMRC